MEILISNERTEFNRQDLIKKSYKRRQKYGIKRQRSNTN